MGIGSSIHKNPGWQGQLARVQRWHSRLKQIATQMSQTKDTELDFDFIYAFFQNCYHLRDWLENSGAISHQKLQDLFRDHYEMQICRDICNGTKHFDLTRPSVDAHFSIGREYVPSNWPSSRPHINQTWFIIAGKTKHDIFELADTCMSHWDRFLAENGLQ